jgi:hypothetical protein
MDSRWMDASEPLEALREQAPRGGGAGRGNGPSTAWGANRLREGPGGHVEGRRCVQLRAAGAP